MKINLLAAGASSQRSRCRSALRSARASIRTRRRLRAKGTTPSRANPASLDEAARQSQSFRRSATAHSIDDQSVFAGPSARKPASIPMPAASCAARSWACCRAISRTSFVRRCARAARRCNACNNRIKTSSIRDSPMRGNRLLRVSLRIRRRPPNSREAPLASRLLDDRRRRVLSGRSARRVCVSVSVSRRTLRCGSRLQA